MESLSARRTLIAGGATMLLSGIAHALTRRLRIVTPGNVGLQQKDYQFLIGDTNVTVRHIKNGDGPVFVHVHDNETDARKVGNDFVMNVGGRFVDLLHGGGRNVQFTVKGQQFGLDPNRIFTPKGLEATLKKNSEGEWQVGMPAAKKLAEKILSFCGTKDPIIALHNNTGHDFGLSSYLPGGQYYRGPGNTFAHLGSYGEHNVTVVTTRELYDACVAQDFTVVYEVPNADKDDGSLSVYFERMPGFRYCNVDTKFGNQEVQAKIVRELYALLTQPPRIGQNVNAKP